MTSRYYISIFCCLILMAWLHKSSHAQGVKKEVERSIARAEMPEQALALLEDLLKEARKVHYYQETDGDARSYECKFFWKGDAYSVEFHEDGTLLDIEKVVTYASLPEKVQDNINAYLDEHFQKTKLLRLQKQFTAEDANEHDREVIEEFMEQDADDLTIRYEMEVNTKKNREINAYEMLFDEDGNYIKQRKMVRRSLDNILY